MTNKDIFKIWAPSGVLWTDWIKPIPFISIDDELKTYEAYKFEIPKLNYITNEEIFSNSAIIIDTHSYTSINEGLAVTEYGFRPIPIFNGVNEQKNSIGNVNNQTLELALVWGAYILSKLKIEDNARPAFLIDSNRLLRYKMSPDVFDNSWDLYHQDLPTAEFFLNNGIKKIIVRSENSFAKDLEKILYKHQLKGIQILFTNGYEAPKEYKIRRITDDKI